MKFTLILAAALLAGCGEAIEASKPTTAPKKVERKPKVEAAVVAAGEAWFYNPAGKRDPFASFMSRPQADSGISPDSPPLQRWDADRFVLTGVIWDVSAPRALLVDPEGTGHVVRFGTYVGRNWGKVTSITQEGVVVTEEYRMIDGEFVVNPVSIRFGGAVKK